MWLDDEFASMLRVEGVMAIPKWFASKGATLDFFMLAESQLHLACNTSSYRIHGAGLTR